MGDVVASVPPSGAGRFVDVSWPSQTFIQSRVVGFNPSSTPNNVGIGGGSSQTYGTYQGIDYLSLDSTAGGAGWGVKFDTLGLLHIITSTPVPWSFRNMDDAVIRIYAVMATGQIPAANRNVGLQIVSNVAGVVPDLMGGGVNGFGLNLDNTGTWQWTCRGPNGLVQSPIPNSDPVNWHAYEIRIVQPVGAIAASLSLLIDNVPVALPALSSSWAAGTNLPAAATGAGRNGFAVYGVADFHVNASLAFRANQGIRIIQAPTLQDCL